MRRLVAVGVFFELALLTIGLTWIRPMSDGQPARATTTSAASTDYRIEGDGTGDVVEVNLVAENTVQEIAPGVKYQVWTFNGTAPGPVIRVHLGDTVRFTLTNDDTMGMQHSIDFHAAQTPWDKNYVPVDPGKSLSFDWVARFPGVFMYHCGVPPVIQHIANGMYGAIIVEPDDLPTAREYVLVSGEFYPSKKPVNGAYVGDYDKMLEGTDPTYVVFNGMADRYKDAPLEARPNELIRLYVVNAGPTLWNSFHVIGALFDHVYPSGNPTNQLNGLQSWSVGPGDGAMYELRIPDAGLYPFVNHSFAYTGRGELGLLKIDPSAPAAPASYPAMGDPFSAGVHPAGSASPTATAASGSTTSDRSTAAACEPKGTKLQIAAEGMAFDTDCLAAPAGRRFTIAFDNRDEGVPHNLAIYTDADAGTALFVGDVITGPKATTYRVPGLDPGTYFFRCDVHPQMNGTFVVA
ncbi:MAG TPA: multicopper oxidase domain-containing protein [Actinomycetota bacterium]|nr:multicopper oxidase domain-containing protein [Actinomycetota bacterium]